MEAEPAVAQREGISDNIMDKQSAYFGTADLYRDADLAGPSAPSKLHVRNLENQQALGGMRRPDLSVRRNPAYRTIGQALHGMAPSFIKDNPTTLQVVRDLRLGKAVSGFSERISAAFRTEWFHTLGMDAPPRGLGPDADVIEAWGQATMDPDAREILPHWLRPGAPLGILEPIELAGVFPPVEPGEPARRPDTLFTELAGWSNYSSAEDEPEVVASLLKAQEDKGHCRFFDSVEQLREYLGEDQVILTKLALVSKLKADGTYKHRLIWDLLRSDVNGAVTLLERIVLPRVQDAVDDAKDLRRLSLAELEWLVMDIADAFHNVPL